MDARLRTLHGEARDPRTDPRADKSTGGSYGGTGLRYWTMGVDDIEAAVAKCEAANAPIHLPVTEIMPGTRIAMIEDPEGNVVEFLESTPRSS